MKELKTNLEDSFFSKALKVSFAAHVAIAAYFTIDVLFFTEAPISFEQAVRVDIVGLPDKVQTEAPKGVDQTPPPAPKEEKKQPPEPIKTEEVAKKEPMPPKNQDKEAINLNKTKNKQKAALEKLKQMQALEAIQKDVQNQKKPGPTQSQYKGNALAAGSELTGVNKLQAEDYTTDVYRHVKQHWIIPEYLRHRSLKAEVLIKIDERGNVISKNLVKSSGNAVFDEVVLSAIEKASPVPPPPDKFMKIASIQGFLFRYSE